MHPVIFDVAGYTLLLSGLITFVMLLREGHKHKKRSPFYILSTSDVFSSMITAILLLVSHINAVVKFNYDWQNNTDDTEIDRMWMIKDEDKYKLLFPRARELNQEVARQVDSNMTFTCNVKDIFMQYGMLLAPLTNALISLLTFAVQCNLNALCVKRRCANVMGPSANDARFGTKHVDIACPRRTTLEDQQELASQRSNVSAKNASIVRRIMKMFRFQATRENDKKPASFLVTSHWLMPFLVTAILCFAEYDDMNTVRHMDDTKCIFQSNFPVKFYVFSDTEDNLKIANFDVHATSLTDYYPVGEEASNKSNLSNAEVNQIVSKVQSIVKNVLSYVRNSTGNITVTNLLDASRLQNMTDYVVMNNISHIEDVTDVDGEAQTTYNTITERITSAYNLSSQADNHTYFNADPEMLLFHNLPQNASERSDMTTPGNSSNLTQISVQSEISSYEEDTPTYLADAKEDATQRIVGIPIAQDATFVSDDQIYADILKRIHIASAYTASKNRRNRSADRFYSRKQSKRNNLEDHIARVKPDSTADLFLHKYDHFERDINAGTSSSPHMINECLVSNKFLKLHLFVLSFVIYFLPILLCCILQVRGEHTCENTLAILKAKVDLVSNLPQDNSNDDDSVVIANEGAHTDWFSTSSGSTDRRNSIDRFNKPLKIRDNHGSTMDVGIMSKNDDNCVEAQNRDMFLEVNCMARICGVVKVSLILCVLLWSPIFLGTLLRVFLCIHAPQWLTDTTFLSAISFGIVRNILDIYIIKIQELCNNNNAKENRIHPVE